MQSTLQHQSDPVKVSVNAGKRINFFTAWLVPRVFLYSATLFTLKMAVYSMLLNLTTFLKEELGYDD